MSEVKNIHLVELDEMMTNPIGTNTMYTKWASNYEQVCFLFAILFYSLIKLQNCWEIFFIKLFV